MSLDSFKTCLTEFDEESFYSASKDINNEERQCISFNHQDPISTTKTVQRWLTQEDTITVYKGPNESALTRFTSNLTKDKDHDDYEFGLAVKNAFLIGANALAILIFHTVPIIRTNPVTELLIVLPVTTIAGLTTALIGIGVISTILAIGLFLTILKLPVHIYNKINDIEPKPPTSTAMKVYNYFTSCLDTAAYKTYSNIKEVLISIRLLLIAIILPLTNKLK